MLKQLQDFLHREIPLTKDMSMELLDFDELSLHAKAPLKHNINDKASFPKDPDFKEVKALIALNRHKRITCLIELIDADANIYSTMTAKYVIIPKTNRV